MKNRCNNPNDKNYCNYGERGIKVCNEWMNDFAVFYNWAVENGYQEGLSIERKDVNGNYCPENCEWITLTAQQFNKRTTKRFEYNGKNLTLVEWSKLLGISADTLASRIYTRKWSVERALTTPVYTNTRNKNARYPIQNDGSILGPKENATDHDFETWLRLYEGREICS